MKKKTNPTNPIYTLFRKEFTKINRCQEKINKLQSDIFQEKKDLQLQIVNEILARISDEATLAFLTCSCDFHGEKRSLVEVLVDCWTWPPSGHKSGYSKEYCFHKSKVINVCKEFELSDPNKFMNDLNRHCSSSDVKFKYYQRGSNRIYLQMYFNNP